MPLTLREHALAVIELADKGAHLQAALDQIVITRKLSSASAASLSDLVYCFYRGRVRTDWLLRRFLAKPEKLPPKMLLLLGVALASLLFQSHTPAYALVSETVELVKKQFGRRLGGVANGFLRSLVRASAEIADPAWHMAEVEPADPFHGLAVYWGIPASIADLWRRAYGSEIAEKLMARSASRPWKGLLINSAHPEAASLRDFFQSAANENIALVGEWGAALAPGAGLEIICGKNLAYWQREGAITPLAAGSQLVLQELGLGQWDRPVWDCCAGAGGKTRALLNMGADVRLASDVSARRAATFQKMRLPEKLSPVYCRMDARFPALSGWKGHIVADVPCSGLGVLARRPDLRKKAANLSAMLAGLEKTQQRILASLLSFLGRGQKLAYITCALNPAENREAVEKALAGFPHLSIEREWQTPHTHLWLEGMYGAVIACKQRPFPKNRKLAAAALCRH